MAVFTTTWRSIDVPTFTWTRRDVPILLVGLALCWWMFAGAPVGPLDLHLGLDGPLASTLPKWLGALLLVVLVLGGERRRLASMLLTRPGGRDLEWALYAFGAAMVWSWVAGAVASQEGNEGVQSIAALGVAGVLVLVVTAAVTEEVVYRGYLAERLGSLVRSRWAGTALSLAVFVVPHLLFFGPSWLLHQLGGTLAVAVVVLVRRNLPAAMLVHLLVNLPILVPTLAAR